MSTALPAKLGTANDLGTRTRHRVTRKLMPFLFVLYVIAYLDRINLGFAGLQMTSDLHFSDAVFGLGSGIFFIGYTLLGIPGAVLVERWSARRAIAVTMVAWGCVAAATGLIHTQTQFYGMRILLGVAEAAFFPGVITYLNMWYIAEDRARAVALFMTAIPISQIVASPISATLMKVHWLGLNGWRWMLILEGVPAVLGGLAAWFYLTDRPAKASWLPSEERNWLVNKLAEEQAERTSAGKTSFWQAIRHPSVLLLCAVYFGGTCGNYGLSLWVPKILQRIGHLSAVKTSWLAAIPAIMVVPLMLLTGWNSDRTGERKWHILVPRVTGGLGLALLALTVDRVSLPLALICLGIAAAGISSAYGPLWGIPATLFASTTTAASIGFIAGIGNLGGLAGPYVIGWFSVKTHSYSGGLWAVAIAIFLSGILVVPLRVRRSGAQ